MIVLGMFTVGLVAFVVWRRRKRAANALAAAPLAGYDTGARYATRTPGGRLHRHKRGF